MVRTTVSGDGWLMMIEVGSKGAWSMLDCLLAWSVMMDWLTDLLIDSLHFQPPKIAGDFSSKPIQGSARNRSGWSFQRRFQFQRCPLVSLCSLSALPQPQPWLQDPLLEGTTTMGGAQTPGTGFTHCLAQIPNHSLSFSPIKDEACFWIPLTLASTQVSRKSAALVTFHWGLLTRAAL